MTSKDDSSHSLIEFVAIDYHAQVMTCGHCHVCSIIIIIIIIILNTVQKSM